jgi:hypothetical protein
MSGADSANLQRLLHESVLGLFRELVDGPGDVAFTINPGDPGLVRSLARLTAAEASARPGARSSVAAHLQHVSYGLDLLNKWAGGDENVFATATYARIWERQQVGEDEWRTLLTEFEQQVRAWMHAIEHREEWDVMSLSTAIGSLAHLAYHLGAMRQVAAAASGPPAAD